ncbi:MAG: CHAT domain-containing protein, partial [Cyanobacteria bacterium P01_D01_bin.56]
ALPGTAAEAEAIAPLFPDATVLTGTQATENALKAIDSPRILHIATHGFFFEDIALETNQDFLNGATFANAGTNFGRTTPVVENPMLRSGLALAGANNRDSGTEDGVLTALEAANLNLEGTQLVVLSACDTGLGDIANGEGVYGLRRSFAIAGAESQLMSLWWVSDEGTQVLMSGYYKNLEQGMGRSEALRAVQLELLNDPQYNYPYYWASFILAGDWKPLE